jgi:Tol biopolymer transport system component
LKSFPKHGQFSPDGHWQAYFSYDTGRPEVYVVPFPGPGRKYQISRSGGWASRWAGKNQLFFLTTGNQLMKADLILTPQNSAVESDGFAISPTARVSKLSAYPSQNAE